VGGKERVRCEFPNVIISCVDKFKAPNITRNTIHNRLTYYIRWVVSRWLNQLWLRLLIESINISLLLWSIRHVEHMLMPGDIRTRACWIKFSIMPSGHLLVYKIFDRSCLEHLAKTSVSYANCATFILRLACLNQPNSTTDHSYSL